MSAYDNWKLAEPPDNSDPFDDIDAEEFYDSLLPSAQRLVDECEANKERTEMLRKLWRSERRHIEEYERENRIF